MQAARERQRDFLSRDGYEFLKWFLSHETEKEILNPWGVSHEVLPALRRRQQVSYNHHLQRIIKLEVVVVVEFTRAGGGGETFDCPEALPPTPHWHPHLEDI